MALYVSGNNVYTVGVREGRTKLLLCHPKVLGRHFCPGTIFRTFSAFAAAVQSSSFLVGIILYQLDPLIITDIRVCHMSTPLKRG